MTDKLAPRERLDLMVSTHPDLMGELFGMVADGGTMVDWCRGRGLKYSVVAMWVESDPGRREMYEKALAHREEWTRQVVLSQLRDMSTFDPRGIYHDDGETLRDLSELPEDLARCIQSMERVGGEWRLKFVDKMKAMEMLGRTLGVFKDKVEHSGGVSLEQLITSIPVVDAPVTVSASAAVPEGEEGEQG